MRNATVAVFASLALLSACTIPPQKLAQMTNAQLCTEYGNNRTDQVRAELLQRNALTPEEWGLVDKKSIKIGMSETAFLCSWGTPTVLGSINTTMTSRGASRQYVYRFCNTCKAHYVYTRAGVVTSWQD